MRSVHFSMLAITSRTCWQTIPMKFRKFKNIFMKCNPRNDVQSQNVANIEKRTFDYNYRCTMVDIHGLGLFNVQCWCWQRWHHNQRLRTMPAQLTLMIRRSTRWQFMFFFIKFWSNDGDLKFFTKQIRQDGYTVWKDRIPRCSERHLETPDWSSGQSIIRDSG